MVATEKKTENAKKSEMAKPSDDDKKTGKTNVNGVNKPDESKKGADSKQIDDAKSCKFIYFNNSKHSIIITKILSGRVHHIWIRHENRSLNIDFATAPSKQTGIGPRETQ